jgi:hypothetical protein
VCAENSDSDVLVMQPADQRMQHDASNPLNRARNWRILVQGAVRSRGVVIARIRFLDVAQMLLAPCDDMVDALATNCSDQPLGKAVLPRRARAMGL